MEPQKHKQEQRHPIPLWIRLCIVISVLVIVFGGATIWIIQGAKAIIPIVAFTALGALLAFFQVLPWLFPGTKQKQPTQNGSRSVLPSPHSASTPFSVLTGPSSTSTSAHTLSFLEGSLQTQAEDNTPPSSNERQHRIDWGGTPHGEQLHGRSEELAELRQWIIGDHCRMVAILGIGGIGKTSLAKALVEQIKDEFEYICWYLLQNAPSLEDILEKCILFFSDQQQVDMPKGVDNLVALLIKYLSNRL